MSSKSASGATPMTTKQPRGIHFADRLAEAVRRFRTAAVVGIDPVLERLPPELQPRDNSLSAAVQAIELFSREVITCVARHVPAVKINSGFFEAFQAPGVAAYYRCIAAAHQHGLLVIGDIKRGDIGSTAELYTRGHLGAPRFDDLAEESIPDAVTLAGYLGRGAVQPFIDAGAATGRGVFVLVRPSDPGADEVHEFGGDVRFYEHMAGLVNRWGSQAGCTGASGLSCVGAVVAPKDIESTKRLRAQMPNAWWLVPGYGAQGATAEHCRPCFRGDGLGALVNASRSVIYAFAGKSGADWRAAVSSAAVEFSAEIRACAGL